ARDAEEAAVLPDQLHQAGVEGGRQLAQAHQPRFEEQARALLRIPLDAGGALPQPCRDGLLQCRPVERRLDTGRLELRAPADPPLLLEAGEVVAHRQVRTARPLVAGDAEAAE